MRKEVVFVCVFLLLAASVSAQDIRVIFPENGVTYGPWSDSYFFFERTQSNAHNIIPNISVNTEAVDHYRMWWNGEINRDSVGEIVNYSNTDTSGRQLVGPYKAMHNLTVVGYDADGNIVDEDMVIFFLAINLDDYYDILEEGSPFLADSPISAEDLASMQVSREQYRQSVGLFTIEKTFTYITAKEKLTGEITNQTKVKISIIPKKKLGAFTLYSIIPKEIASSVNEVILTGNVTVLNPDPLMAWHFGAGEQELEYHVTGHAVEDDLKGLKVIPLANPQRSKLYYFLPIFLVPVIIFFLVYFSRFQKKR